LKGSDLSARIDIVHSRAILIVGSSPLQSRELYHNGLLFLVLIVTVYLSIAFPPVGGASQLMITFERETSMTVLGTAGLSGYCAASMEIGAEYSLGPISFLASTLNL